MQNEILVTCYTNPDIDGFACVLAYSELLTAQGRPAVAGIFGQVHDEAEFIMEKFKFEYPKKAEIKNFEKFVLVDASTLPGLPEGLETSKVVEVIDHRKKNQSHEFKNAVCKIEMVGAAATLVAEEYKKSGMEISSRARHLLYAAIVSNTLNFKSLNTTARDHAAAAWLALGVEGPAELSREMFIYKSDVSGEKLFSRMENETAETEAWGKKIGIVQMEVLEARALAEDRKSEILSELARIKQAHKMDGIFASIIGLDEEVNVFICEDGWLQNSLEKTFNISFTNSVAARPGFILRKEIIPLLV